MNLCILPNSVRMPLCRPCATSHHREQPEVFEKPSRLLKRVGRGNEMMSPRHDIMLILVVFLPAYGEEGFMNSPYISNVWRKSIVAACIMLVSISLIRLMPVRSPGWFHSHVSCRIGRCFRMSSDTHRGQLVWL